MILQAIWNETKLALLLGKRLKNDLRKTKFHKLCKPTANNENSIHSHTYLILDQVALKIFILNK